MTGQLFESHAERARRGQWELEELPWDEPIHFCGASRRERLLCKLDTVDMVHVMYHLQLGARMRLGDYQVRAWRQDRDLLACVEWHDTDEQRHVRVLRKLIGTLTAKGESLERNDRPSSPEHIWKVAYSSRDRMNDERVLLHMLIDEAACRTLFAEVAARSRIPLVRAAFAACAQDDLRHGEYLTVLARERFEHLSSYALARLRASALMHVARLQSALRPHIPSFSGCGRGTPESVVAGVFAAASRALSELGPDWQRSALMRVVHVADRGPWMLWLLR
jgi:hypothetical protein